jgi:hypothetical protein
MKITSIVVIAAVAGARLWAESEPGQKATLTVCIESDPYMPSGALPLTSKMFASIGVRIDWRDEHRCPVGVGAIVVSLSYNRNDEVTSDLGFAQPYEGTHVVVFPNRVRLLDPYQRQCVLAHVLVHEITHVLEGICRHSATGIMKARWGQRDYLEMSCKPLPFAQDDVDLIYAGLRARQARVATAVTAVVSVEAVAVQ